MTTASIIASFGAIEVTVTRFAKGRLVGGKFKASKQRPFKVKTRVQPVNGREREFLPEGWRQKYLRKLYLEERLFTDDDQNAQRADLLTIEGEEFEVMQVEKRKGLGLDHFKVFAARRND